MQEFWKIGRSYMFRNPHEDLGLLQDADRRIRCNAFRSTEQDKMPEFRWVGARSCFLLIAIDEIFIHQQPSDYVEFEVLCEGHTIFIITNRLHDAGHFFEEIFGDDNEQ